MELIINLIEEPLSIAQPHHLQQQNMIAVPMVNGVRSEYFVVETRQPASILAVWFKPGGALQFFGVSAAELHNLHVPLANIWGQTAHDLYHQLLAITNTQARFQLLEQTLLRRLLTNRKRHPVVEFALSFLRQSPAIPTIAHILDQIALSPTRFIQVFREDVGLTPKVFCRVTRFQQALARIAVQPSRQWLDVALACGYYDQAHFINEFRSFAGITPSLYFPQSREHFSNLPLFDESENFSNTTA
jgi:AraC-like DNA-binding protein